MRTNEVSGFCVVAGVFAGGVSFLNLNFPVFLPNGGRVLMSLKMARANIERFTEEDFKTDHRPSESKDREDFAVFENVDHPAGWGDILGVGSEYPVLPTLDRIVSDGRRATVFMGLSPNALTAVYAALRGGLPQSYETAVDVCAHILLTDEAYRGYAARMVAEQPAPTVAAGTTKPK